MPITSEDNPGVDEPQTVDEFMEVAEREYCDLVERVALLLLALEAADTSDVAIMVTQFGVNVMRTAHEYKNVTIH